MSQNEDRVRLHVIVSGRVQQVGFRAFTQKAAIQLGICGWVKNLNTGEVELLAVGYPTAVDEFLKKIATGPALAKVERITTLKEQNSDMEIKDTEFVIL